MAISNYTFTRIYHDLKPRILNARISKIVKISPLDFSFYLYANKQESLIFSFDGMNPYMLISSSYFKMISETNGFTASLKKYFEGGTIIDFKKINEDKIFIFTIKKMTPTYQIIINKLVVELIPYRPNAIIMDENNIIIDALKKSSSLDDPNLIIKGVHYQPNIKIANEFTKDDTLESLKTKLTKLVYNEVCYRVEHGEDIPSIIEEIYNSNTYYSYNQDIVSIYLKSVNGCKEIKLEDLSSIYEEKEQNKYKKDHYSLALHTVEHKLKGLKKKLINLENDLKKATIKANYVEIGNLLFMNIDQYQKGMTEIEIEGIKIKLDEKLDLIGNANKYFKEYQKSKKALEQIEIQKSITKEKIDYFEKINSQIKFATPNDMEEILLELKNDGYLPKEKNQHNKKNKVRTYNPHYLFSNDGFKIGFGLSSFQNDYLTFELARKNDYFLHVKDEHGPHVIIFSDNPSEEAITLASEIALYFANKNMGEVYLLDKKDVKKIPGKLGKVSFTNYQVITLSSIREESIKLFKESLKK